MANPDTGIPDRAFPPGFLFGTATAAFQNEGNRAGDPFPRNSDWEALYSSKEYSRLNDSSPDWWTDDGREALSDLTVLRRLGLNAQRHGVEWARIEPEPGHISAGALASYRRQFDYMKEIGLKPVFNLHHFSSPAWWPGFETRAGCRTFEDFAKRMADAFGDLNIWLTLTEPNSYLAAGYLLGLRPPHRKSYRAFAVTAYHLAKAHETVYGILKERVTDAQVGVAHSIFWVNALEPRLAGDRLAASATRWFTAYLSPRLLQPCDFIGVNFFYGLKARWNPWREFFASGVYPSNEAVNMPRRLPFGAELLRPSGPVSDCGWPVTPEVFVQALEAVYDRFRKPLIVTSNGVSDATDRIRPYYLLTHLMAASEAISRGVDIRGYFHWTAVTSREWEEGISPRLDFGLIGVDPRTGERQVRPSARMFGRIAASGRMQMEELAGYLTPQQQLDLQSFESRIRVT